MYLSPPPNLVEVLFYMQEPLLIGDNESKGQKASDYGKNGRQGCSLSSVLFVLTPGSDH